MSQVQHSNQDTYVQSLAKAELEGKQVSILIEEGAPQIINM